MQRKPRMYVERLAKKLNCSDVSSSEAMLECLRDISPELIIEKSEDAVSNGEKFIFLLNGLVLKMQEVIYFFIYSEILKELK